MKPIVAVALAFAASGSALVAQDSSAKAPPGGTVPFRDPIYEVEAFGDVHYGTAVNPSNCVEELLMLDLYVPKDSGTTKRPGYVYLHPGGFWFGDKRDATCVRTCTRFARRGYVAVSINYRLRKGNKRFIGAQIAAEDAKAAVRWLRKNAARLKLDSDRIAVTGESAAGDSALIVGHTDDPGQSGNPGFPHTVQAVSSLWSFYSAKIKPGGAPVWLTHGKRDTLTPIAFARLVLAQCRAAGVYGELFAHNGGHNGWDEESAFIPSLVDFQYERLKLAQLGGVHRHSARGDRKVRLAIGGTGGDRYFVIVGPRRIDIDMGPRGKVLIDPGSSTPIAGGKLDPKVRLMMVEHAFDFPATAKGKLYWQVIYLRGTDPLPVLFSNVVETEFR